MTELTSPGRVPSGRYQLVEPLARGGMATVWIADDRGLSLRVAVKVLRSDLAADDALRTCFRNEAVAATKVGHPNIVATYDTGDDDGTAYIVMELVNGPTLRRIIDEVGGLPVRDVLRIGGQVAGALDAAHRAGPVHRDVKPANVLGRRWAPRMPQTVLRGGVVSRRCCVRSRNAWSDGQLRWELGEPSRATPFISAKAWPRRRGFSDEHLWVTESRCASAVVISSAI